MLIFKSSEGSVSNMNENEPAHASDLNEIGNVHIKQGYSQSRQPIWQVDLKHTLGQGAEQFKLAINFNSVCQRIVLMGPSGAGKSQTLLMLAGLVKPKQGSICFKNHMLFNTSKKVNLSPQQRRVSYMFQDYALFEHLTVAQNIGFALSRGLFNPGLKRIDYKVFVWLNRLGMADAASKYPHQLSGGQKQRVALARSLVHKPDALLLDEPFAALDRNIRGELRGLLIDIQTELSIPMILITHDAEDAQAFAQETIELHAGKIVEK
jgi:molybdate transport system ATP-binding protein